jgi:hypothetical protein
MSDFAIDEAIAEKVNTLLMLLEEVAPQIWA